MKKLFFLAAALLVSAATLFWVDKVYLKDGSILRGRITAQDKSTLTSKTKYGFQEVPKLGKKVTEKKAANELPSISILTCGTVDDADGNTYNTVLIGGQCWMRENMRTTKYPDGSNITKGPSAYGAADWDTDQSYYSCPPNTGNNGEDCAAAGGAEKLGMLYQWSAAMNGSTSERAQGICPSGWHIPTHDEFTILEREVCTSTSCTADFPFDTDTEGDRGTDERIKLRSGGASGFDDLLAGSRGTIGSYFARGYCTNLWSSSRYGLYVWARAGVFRFVDDKAEGFSVRCLKDPSNTAPNNPNTPSGVSEGTVDVSYEFSTSATDPDSNQVQYRFYWGDASTSPWTSRVDSGNSANKSHSWLSANTYYVKAQAKNSNGVISNWSNALTVTVSGGPSTCGTGTVDDADSNTYSTVLIGGQCWMGENMRTTKYPGGSSITKGPSAHGADGWDTDQSYYSCPPNISNDGEDCAAAGGTEKLGMLYQWSTAMNGSTSEGVQGICPSGWHVPTDAQYKTLEMALGMTQTQADATDWRGTTEGDEMKKAGLCEGRTPCGTSGFDSLLTGFRGSTGYYNKRDKDTMLRWSSLPYGGSAEVRNLHVSVTTVSRLTYPKAGGFSVRCLRD